MWHHKKVTLTFHTSQSGDKEKCLRTTGASLERVPCVGALAPMDFHLNTLVTITKPNL